MHKNISLGRSGKSWLFYGIKTINLIRKFNQIALFLRLSHDLRQPRVFFAASKTSYCVQNDGRRFGSGQVQTKSWAWDRRFESYPFCTLFAPTGMGAPVELSSDLCESEHFERNKVDRQILDVLIGNRSYMRKRNFRLHCLPTICSDWDRCPVCSRQATCVSRSIFW